MNTLALIEPDWPAPKNVSAYITCRQGGLSQGPYHSLNVGQHVGDDPARVAANRALLPMAKNIVWLQQSHSTLCRALNTKDKLLGQAVPGDASFTIQPNLVCGVMTADCLPLLLCDQQGSCVAAIHAGWRGLAEGIIENTLQHLPCANEHLMAWMGPAISQTYFEVGAEVKRAFPGHEAAFLPSTGKAGREGKFMADIYQIATEKLRAKGLKAIYGGEYCSYTQENLFFSHRRSVHKGQENTGRMVSCIYFC